MNNTSENILQISILSLSALPEVKSIGISGSKNPLPKPCEGDIDVFVYCDAIPSSEARQSVLEDLRNFLQNSRVGALEKGHWGLGDFTRINGVETWLMYFTTEEATDELDSILNGDCPDKLDNYYYPVGGCAMLKNTTVLYEKDGFLKSIQKRLSDYPENWPLS